jgi:DNA-binding response OmpR family regulator
MRNDPQASDNANARLRVLIVEDEALISMLIESTVRDLGHEAAGCAYSVSDALALMDETPDPIDAAMLDVNLGGKLVFPVAEVLSERGIPFAFLTGYGASGVPEQFAGALVMQKPFSEDDLAFALRNLQEKCSRRAEGAA